MNVLSNIEVWKDIPGYEGLYQISSLGKVKSLPRKSWNGFVFINRKERILKNVLTTTGYFSVSLYRNDNKKFNQVHRLVLLAFIGKSELDVNHKNGIKTDNRIENLEYLTRADNQKHAYLTGLKPPLKGERNPNSKLTEKTVLEIRRLYESGKYRCSELAKMYKIGWTTVHEIVTNKRWSHL